ncbi:MULTISPECIES: hypothetical protein [Streptomycetaceae]|uniref:hypothetical protein n=1 Tax=Streptomycetaceae TaxID=2062 RepID=UPI000213FC3A|nr:MULTISPECIES: hypothetical protein [Streptomycetaceae]MYS60603.1 hypothetical protein [Streptomyces sp. SID5468]CCB76409.1 protein of unknown function [Streptantibioticus cattleyicolor NRRL 8057 = DSM 46488]
MSERHDRAADDDRVPGAVVPGVRDAGGPRPDGTHHAAADPDAFTPARRPVTGPAPPGAAGEPAPGEGTFHLFGGPGADGPSATVVPGPQKAAVLFVTGLAAALVVLIGAVVCFGIGRPAPAPPAVPPPVTAVPASVPAPSPSSSPSLTRLPGRPAHHTALGG